MNFELIYHAPGGRRYFENEQGQVAVADLSINESQDPASCEDGLLIIDFNTPTRFKDPHGQSVPVINEQEVLGWIYMLHSDMDKLEDASGYRFDRKQ